MNANVKEQNDYCGVTRWHDAGITGKGVVVWNCESLNSNHGQKTAQRIYDASPDCTVISSSDSYHVSDRVLIGAYAVRDNIRYTIEDFIIRYKIKIVTRSKETGFTENSPQGQLWKYLIEKYNLIYINCVHNQNELEDRTDVVPILVSACGLIDGKPKRDNYSNRGNGLDFTTFRGIFTGTSFAAPYLAGQIALLVERYRDITQEEAIDYLKSHCEDLEADGYDANTGHGLPILGDLEEEYFMPKEIKMTIGNSKAIVDGKEILLNTPAEYNKEGNRMMVGVKDIATMFGLKTLWDEKTKTATFYKN